MSAFNGVAGTPPIGGCPACGSEVRDERGLVPGFTGMPVTCGDDWHDEDEPNPYEAACERFNAALGACGRARVEADRLLRETEDEFEAARANLRQYETSPGIPLPQYREQVTA